MAKSTAVSEAKIRELKDQLQFRGFSVAESKTAEGYAKITLNTDEASIWVEQQDAVSKDVFGNNLKAFTPHKMNFASRDDAMTSLKVAQILTELAKHGMKINVKTHATVLATAEADDGTDIQFSVRWQDKGI